MNCDRICKASVKLGSMIFNMYNTEVHSFCKKCFWNL